MYFRKLSRLACLMTALCALQSQAATELRLQLDGPLDSPKGRMAKVFKDNIERQTDELHVTILHQSQTAQNEIGSINQLKNNQIQFLIPRIRSLDVNTPALSVFNIPFMFRDANSVSHFQHSASGQELLNSLSNQGLKGLGYMYGGMNQILSARRAKLPTDMKGLVFPTTFDAASNRLYRELGATTADPLPDLISAINEGKITAVEATYEEIYQDQFPPKLRYISSTSHSPRGYILSTSQTFWNGLSAHNKTVINNATDAAVNFGNRASYAAEKNSGEQLRLAGTRRNVRIKEKDRAVWVDFVQPVWTEAAAAAGQNLFQKAFAYANKLHFYTESFPPYNYEENGELTGISVDILKAAYDRSPYRELGLNLELKTWSYGYQATLDGPNVVLFSTTRTPGREDLFKWAGPVAASETKVITRVRDNLGISSPEQLIPKRVGVVRDDIGEAVAKQKGIPSTSLKLYSDVTKALSDLSDRLVDAVIYEEAVARYRMKKAGLKPSDFDFGLILNEGDMYFAFSSDVSDDIVAGFQKAIDQLKTTKGGNNQTLYQEIYRKYQ